MTEKNLNIMIHANKTQEIDTLSRTMWGEARGEGSRGLQAVGHVVLNRVARAKNDSAHGWWGTTIIAVCRKPYQFSCWNGHDPSREKLLNVTFKNPEFRLARAIAIRLLDDPNVYDITRGATHYHRFDIHPYWAKGHAATIRIGAHIFYDLG